MKISESNKTLLLSAFLIAAVSIAVYFNTLSNGFVYDDNSQILQNPWIKNVRNLPEVFYKSVWSFQAAATSNYYRPMMHIIYMANYHLFGFAPWGFHLVNVLFHAANSVLVLAIAARLLGGIAATPLAKGAMGGIFSLPFLAALLFATHPIHTEAVAWVGAVTDLSYAFFFLLSFYFHMKAGEGRESSFRLLSLLSFAVSLLCKEPAATLPFVLIAYDYAFRSRPDEEPGGRSLKRYLPYLAILGIYMIVRTYALGSLAPVKSHGNLDAYRYAINALSLFAGYLGKILLPVDLNAFYVFHPVASLLEFKGIVGAIVVLAYAGATAVAYRKNRVAFFGLVLFAAPLLPALYIPALGEASFAERYIYLPSAGFVILPAAFLATSRRKMRQYGTAILLSALVLATLYSVQAVKRNPVWKDDLVLFSDIVSKSPDGELPNGMLGIALMSAGRFDESVDQFQKTLRLNPFSAKAHYNLGLTLMKMGRPGEAIPEFEIALTITPNDPDARRNLANSYARLGRDEKAIEQFRILVASNANSPEIFLDFGVALRKQGLAEEAIESYRKALAIDPEYAEAHFNLGNVFADTGRTDNAIEHYRSAVRLQPGNAFFRNMLGITYGQQGAYGEAVEQFTEAVKLAPSEPAYRRNLDRASGMKTSPEKNQRSGGAQVGK